MRKYLFSFGSGSLLVGVFVDSKSTLFGYLPQFLPGQRRNYVSRYLRCTNAISSGYPEHREARIVDEFIRRYLRPDGVFLLRLIQTNGGDLLVGEIVAALFNRYRTRLEETNGKPRNIGE